MITIRHALSLKATTAAVRKALTTSAGITGWWSKDANIGSGPDAQHVLRFRKADQVIQMTFRVDDDSPSNVAWTCLDNGNPAWVGTTLTWKLTEEGDSTRVVFEHAGFQDSASPLYKMTVQGWEPFIESLRSYVEDGVGQPM